MLVIVCTSALCGCDDTASTPWQGYATNKRTGEAEWWFKRYASYEDCRQDLRYHMTRAMEANWYREPYGCGYASNSYWKVLLEHWLHNEKNFTCIGRSTDGSSEESRTRYSAVIGKLRSGEGWYCVD
jgi:hypothetical protein